MSRRYLYAIIFLISLGWAFFAFAQTPPDTGKILQEQTQKPPQTPNKGINIGIQNPTKLTNQSGGAKIRILSVNIIGATVFSTKELIAALGNFSGKFYDMAGLRQLADKITNYYEKKGYPFVRAIIPPQNIKNGKLTIQVIEGRFGKVSVIGKNPLAQKASAFLNTLKKGDIITTASLERTTLILSDQPGIKIVPILKPGEEVGYGDLNVYVDLAQKVNTNIGVDNYGDRYTGEYRGYVGFNINSPFILGDQITTTFVHSNKKLWLGDIGYNLPLGVSGLRGKVGYTHTYYKLGKEFTDLDATGSADIGYLGFSYPIIRSRKANLTIDTIFQYKYLKDKQGAINVDYRKHSYPLPVTLSFDIYDSFLGGGVIYGNIVYTHGFLKLNDDLEKSDRESGLDTRGNFDKINLDVSRIQVTPIPHLMLFGRFAAQLASKNLDSSESFILGGANGVRAYPLGEGSGDEGWLAQIETRYSISFFSPYLFYDTGYVRINRKNNIEIPANPNHRKIGGCGVGLRVNYKKFSANLSVAWRTSGGKPKSDSKDRNPRVWFSASYKF